MKNFKILIILITIITTFTFTQTANASEDSETSVTKEQYYMNIKGIQELHPKRAISLIKSNKSYFLYVGYDDCPYCREFSKVLKDFKSKSVLPIYYLNLKTPSNKLNEKDQIILENFIQKRMNFEGTPTFLKISKQRVINNFVGSGTSLNDLESINYK